MTVQSTRPAAPGAVAWPTADEMAMEKLAGSWQPAYDVGFADGAYRAFRWPDGPLITAATIDGLDSAIRADSARSR
jgi:hypothetical protein